MKSYVQRCCALAIIALLGMLPQGAGADAQPVQPMASAADIVQTLDTYTNAHRNAVMIAGVIDGNTVRVYASGHGPENGSPPNESSAFQIGSVTKTFTGALLAQMVRAGDVSLDDPISKYLPSGVTAPSFDGKPITLRSLAEQNSGLPRLASDFHPADMRNPYADYTAAQMYDFLSHYQLTRAPGAEYEYSNLGVTLLGQLLANREHTTYAALLEARILRPLGMIQTVVTGNATSRANLVPGYASDGSAQPPWDFGALGAAGSIESTMHDMLIYLQANLAAPKGTLGGALSLAQKTQVPVGLHGALQIGLIWMTNINSGITFHNGETGGYHSFIGFDRAAQHGVVILANVADMDVDLVGTHILAPYVPAPAGPNPAQMEASPYSGRYLLSPSFVITIYKSHGQLYARATNQPPFALTPVSGHAFAVQGVDARITFEVDSSGTATALTLHQNGVDQRAVKSP